MALPLTSLTMCTELYTLITDGVRVIKSIGMQIEGAICFAINIHSDNLIIVYVVLLI